MGERLVLPHGGAPVELPNANQPGRPLRLVGEDRQASVHLHRIRGNDLAPKRGPQRPRYPCIEPANTPPPPSPPPSRSATSDFPDAVGPKIATTSIATSPIVVF